MTDHNDGFAYVFPSLKASIFSPLCVSYPDTTRHYPTRHSRFLQTTILAFEYDDRSSELHSRDDDLVAHPVCICDCVRHTEKGCTGTGFHEER
mmetsp:Transcript_23077/g.54473  ORF Transcript_23077/g.54473 Transcript_23077/m.54473 type:complete len:93 (+) Transcript_23077:3-281(+)